jgi:hypothetical protein
MMRKLLIGGLAVAGLAIAFQRHDIVRYLKIKQMSLGEGHPELVPADGATSYAAPGHGTPEGTGDFDPAGRGGPGPVQRYAAELAQASPAPEVCIIATVPHCRQDRAAGHVIPTPGSSAVSSFRERPLTGVTPRKHKVS